MITRPAFLFVFLFLLASCRDELPLDTFDYENYLVVEATLTNVKKRQEIRLSRTTQLDTSFANLENNAEVYVMANNSTRYDFEQDDSDGSYFSNEAFSAQTGNDYQLFINTSNGRSYSSTVVRPSPPAMIKDFYTERTINTDSITGIQVLMDIDGGDNRFFRFEYEETYKIVSPYPSPVDYEIINYEEDINQSISYEVTTTPNTRQERVCYSTENSTGINLGTSSSLTGNNLNRQPILFIPADSPKIGERYSILGTVYTQGQASYTFYKNLRDLSTNDDLLSQKQPGFIVGNMSSLESQNEEVLGFFDVSLQTERRIYFNYVDFEFLPPPFFYFCELDYYDYNDNTTLDLTPNYRRLLYTSLLTGDYRIFSTSPIPDYTNFALIRDYCSDCTLFSSNKKPEFWED